MSGLIADGRLHVAAVSAPSGLAMAARARTYRRLLPELPLM